MTRGVVVAAIAGAFRSRQRGRDSPPISRISPRCHVVSSRGLVVRGDLHGGRTVRVEVRKIGQ
jgi:hypothetical protein